MLSQKLSRRAHRLGILGVAVALGVVVSGVADTQAGARHGHKLTMHYWETSTVVPSRSDPLTSGVKELTIDCRPGSYATGGGYTSDAVVVVPKADLFPSSYQVVAINQTDTPGKLTVSVACVRGKTRATSARARRPDPGRLVRAYRAALRR